jgi:tryptophan synthase alpha subunit
LSDGALAARWAWLRGRRRTALIPFLTAGFPILNATADGLEGTA